MAIKGSATVTLTSYRDTQSVTRYYKLQTAGSSTPSKPTTKPPSSDWTDLEPDCDISKELYFCDLTIFSNGEWEYSSVSKSSSYEAAKEAYNKAQNASETLKAESARIDNLETGKANIADLNVEKARINNLESTKADITSLNAGIARIDTLETNKADIDLANVNNAWITNGVIKDASIANEKVISVSANKLTAGTIDASKITVTNLNADNITVGTINGARIGDSSIDLDKLSQEVPTKEYLDSVEQKLQEEIDGAIETFTVSQIPTLNNEPAVNWTTDNIKSTHVGDLCYVVNNTSDNDGFCYRFQYNGTAYSWALIKDNDVTKAIQDIAELNGEVTQFKTDYTSKVSEIDGGIESLKSRTTTIETTYSTKTYTDTKTSDALTSANSYADTKASSALTDAKSYADSTASTAKSEAISTASADATSKANSALDSAKSYTDAVEIGGRNLALSFYDNYHVGSSSGMRTVTFSGWSVPAKITPNITVDANEEYISRCYIECVSCSVEGATVGLGIQGLKNGSYNSQTIVGTIGVGESAWIEVHHTTKADENGISLQIRNNNHTNTATVNYRFLKLEKGNKATDWTPAPEDVDAGIANVQSTADTAKANAATAQSTADTAKANAAAAQTAASNAQTTANEAKAKAEAAQKAVSTKVETSVFNTLKNTVDENSANITSLTNTVTTKADSSTVTALSNTVNQVKQTADTNSSSISNLKTTVNSKADGSKVTALENKASTIEQNLSGVTTRVDSLESENEGLDTRLKAAESKITDDAIVNTVTSSKTYKDALSGKVDTSVYNTKMEQLDNSISLKATATDVYTKTQANAAFDAKGSAATAKSEAISSANSYTDTATTDMATEEFVTSQGYLTVTSDAITSKVSKNEVISAINQTAESVSINAEKISLTGAVTFSSFDNSLQTTINNKAETSDLEGVRTVATNTAKIVTNHMEYDSTNGLIVGNKTGGSFVGSRAQVLPDSFNILDTDGTKLASFGETTVIGNTDKANLYLTYNELYMEDKDDKVFFKVGDYRNSTGVATLTYTDTTKVNVSAGRVFVALSIPAKIESVISVVVEGTTISKDNYRFSIIDEELNGEVIDHTTSMWVEGLTHGEGDKVKVEVTYTTKSPYSYHVFGLPDKSLIPGRFSSSEGWCTRASGEYTHAEGRRSTASGYASHAEGSSHAYGYLSHAEGSSTANGEYSHAEGNSTTGRKAKFSHAEGDNTVASSESQHVSGAFNIADGDGKYVFIIGNGSGFSSRSNAMTVDWDGVPTFYGMAGEIKMWAGDTIPNGWLLCDGSEISKTDYPYLYAAIGDLWGVPSSSSNFKLPNLTGRVPVGYNSSDTDFAPVGHTGGEKTHKLTIAEMPSHNHSRNYYSSNWSANGSKSGYHGHDGGTKKVTGSTGGNGAHNNLQPYAVIKYIICAI